VSIKLGVYLFLIFSFATACQRESIADQRGSGGKKSIHSIPIEYVDAETNGKKSGGTHFTLSSDQLFLDYENFDDEAGASAKLNKARSNAKQFIEEGNVQGDGGVIAGKYSVTENRSRYENDRFCLTWTRVNRYAQVCSASTQAIEEFRTVYDL